MRGGKKRRFNKGASRRRIHPLVRFLNFLYSQGATSPQVVGSECRPTNNTMTITNQRITVKISNHHGMTPEQLAEAVAQAHTDGVDATFNVSRSCWDVVSQTMLHIVSRITLVDRLAC